MSNPDDSTMDISSVEKNTKSTEIKSAFYHPLSAPVDIQTEIASDILIGAHVQPTSHRTTQTSLPFKLFPSEIRNKIYRLLLVNSVLGSMKSIKKSTEYGKMQKYGLTPAVLRTCKAICDEATPILYGDNDFVICCQHPMLGDPYSNRFGPDDESKFTFQLRHYLSPLFRYSTNPSILMSSAVKVRRWNILLSFWAPRRSHYSPLLLLCRTLCHQELKSIKVFLLSYERTQQYVGKDCQHPGPFSIAEILQPLTLLRATQSMEFNFAKHEVPLARPSEISIDEIPNPGLFDIVAMKLLVRGTTQVEAVFKMYPALLGYAQSFERFEGYQAAMDGIGDYARPDYHSPHRLPFERINTMNRPCGPPSDWSQSEIYTSFNPFSHTILDIVEQGLHTIRVELNSNDVPSFKKLRRDIIEHLEPQYQRVARLMDCLTLFIKEHKRDKGFLHPGGPRKILTNKGPYVEGIILLESLEHAFGRDMSRETQLLARAQKRAFDNKYVRKSWLKDMSKALEFESIRRFVELFKMVSKDMDEQYLKIRKARKSLFDFDTPKTDHKCDIDLEAWRNDEEIRWEVEEPHMGPETAPPKYSNVRADRGSSPYDSQRL